MNGPVDNSNRYEVAKIMYDFMYDKYHTNGMSPIESFRWQKQVFPLHHPQNEYGREIRIMPTWEDIVDEREMRIRLTLENIKPQILFKDEIINSSSLPWCPRIKEKPNSLKPLSIFLENTEKGLEYCHPYEFEISSFSPSLIQSGLHCYNIRRPHPIEDTPLILVDSADQINELIETLLNCKEFAVDLEHHSVRSYMGITCLMQISTSDKDYLIDTLLLRNDLYLLNDVFTNPTILKIFHGADNDIQWLQRDLSIYVVNMFDTYQAAQELEYSGLSLVCLIESICDVDVNKGLQLYDWRKRPLSEKLKQYARNDTHYLLYIYKTLKNELLDKSNGVSRLKSVFRKSNDICKKRYFRFVLETDSHLSLYRKSKKMFNKKSQVFVLKQLFRWRDELARKEDESPQYLMPNSMLLKIAETLPTTTQGILDGYEYSSPLVRSHLLEIRQIIFKVRDQFPEEFYFGESTLESTTYVRKRLNSQYPNIPEGYVPSVGSTNDTSCLVAFFKIVFCGFCLFFIFIPILFSLIKPPKQ